MLVRGEIDNKTLSTSGKRRRNSNLHLLPPFQD